MTAPRRRSTRSDSRSSAPRTRSTSRRRSGFAWPSLDVAPEVLRSIVGIALMVVGAVVLIGLMLPGQGALTDWVRDVIAPWFGTGRWILPFILLGAGIYVERAPGARSGWGATLLGLTIGFVGLVGVIAVFVDAGYLDGRSGGRIGSFLADALTPLVTTPGAFLISLALVIIGTLITLDATLGELLSPARRAAIGARSVLLAPRGMGEPPAANGRGDRTNGAIHPGPSPRGTDQRTDVPPVPVPVPILAATPPTVLAPAHMEPVAGVERTAADLGAADRDHDGVIEVSDALAGREDREYRLPPLSLLDDIAPQTGDARMDHVRNAEIITIKLASFNIPVQVTGWNAGPVVTQYEVKPDDAVKVSKIEALADDLAMALAARTIRIEAPIPGKTVVGIEIPNADFNVVRLRRILESPEAQAVESKLAFALGRDVAGHARIPDLAKMPHLLIAGATGSGKSVMVNALITSLLVRSTPADVRLILVDMKGGVELASYNGAPHLLVPIISETANAKAALQWAVREMDSRYRRFAGAAARNLAGYNAERVDPADRLPQIVIVIDELADLMMRDGRSVEEPIVRIAQKARATGIHLVLATQRPSVNVVTGLIKANFPSRIAFAMASQIDSRTILDAPGAESLIGRGDMLFQPSDLPKPIRLQGVFVSDREIGKVVEHWRAEAEPHYDLGIVASDDDSTGQADDLTDDDADRLLPDAVAVIQEYDRASASLLQRRLKIGYARAARIIDQLEERGYVGKFDGSNARPVLRREEPRTSARATADPDPDLER